jgi:hypothetical protein
MAWVIDEQMSMEHWWNNPDERKPKYLEEYLSRCHFVHHKSHIDWRGLEQEPPRWEAGDQQPERWQILGELFTLM